jgi:hypothetical protein
LEKIRKIIKFQEYVEILIKDQWLVYWIKNLKNIRFRYFYYYLVYQPNENISSFHTTHIVHCTSDSECNIKLGLVCSKTTKTCECISPWFWSQYDARCSNCLNNWKFINNNCLSPLFQTKNSKDAYYKCREFNAFQINLIDSENYMTYVKMNVAPFPGVYVINYIFLYSFQNISMNVE